VSRSLTPVVNRVSRNVILGSVFVLLLSFQAMGEPEPVRLLGGSDLASFYSFLKDFGVDKDPDKVFTFTNGVLRISGQHYGYLATRATNFANYKLVAEFKWGEQTWLPRLTNSSDSGILVHCAGKDGVWPKSIEAQIIEGGTGDILVVS